MTLATLATALLVAQAAPSRTATPIQEASLFKNGYAFVTRSLKPEASGTTKFIPPAQAVHGTLWFTSTGGTKIRSLTYTTEKVVSEFSAGNLVQFLRLNLGKTVILAMRKGSEVASVEVTGTLLEANDQMILLRQSNGVASYRTGDLVNATVPTDAKITGQTERMEPLVEMLTSGSGAINMFTVEPGLEWVPNYLIDLSDPKQMKLTARCTVTNNLADLSGATLNFVTGSPQIAYLGQQDPFLQMVQAMRGAGAPGGFGGGGGMQMMNTAAEGRIAADGAMPFEVGGSGEQIGDLYFYKVKNINLKRGDRSYLILFEGQNAYDTLFNAEVDAGMRDGVIPFSRSLRFVNKQDKPLTSASAMIVKDGEMMGQGALSYTSIGQEALVPFSSALDVRGELKEEEVERKPDAQRRRDGSSWDLVTIRGTVQVRNLRNEEVGIRLRKVIEGDATAPQGKVRKLSVGLNAVNPVSEVTWETKLKPGETLELTYRYSVYTR